ncbi:MAG TPA: GDP-L-fucose synthase [Cyclobacteriaceae bacterium]|nr:GDP-L-fucose synthase [Cyclobacteriaceae bacterium]
MEKHARIFIAGHKGMVGSAIYRKLQELGFDDFILRNSRQLDLRDQAQVARFFEMEQPDYVFLSAARVGGIHANNNNRGEFIYDNLMIQSNIIHQSFVHGVSKLMFLGSSCIYPKFAVQPIREESLLTGLLESTNEPYAIAKIAGIKMCQAYRQQYACNFISLMPTNLYGPNDNYDLMNSHVLPALIRKMHEGKVSLSPEVKVWGSGTPKREFLHVDDLADACIFLMENYDSPEIINVGTGVDISIRDLAQIVKREVGFEGELVFDETYPDGTPRKLLDTSVINKLGWYPKIGLEDGIGMVYKDFLRETAGVEEEAVVSYSGGVRG